MGSQSLGAKLGLEHIKERSQARPWWKEELKFEIERLKALLREPALTEEERVIAESQIATYREMWAMTERPHADWLQQMYLLA